MKADKKKKKARSRIASYEDLDRKKRKPLNNTELSYFCGQMALILTAGISSLEGIEMMEKDFSSREDQELLLDIYDAMSESGELYSSLERTGVFPSYMTNMIRIGEETGNLDDVMSALEIYYEREEQLRKSIQSAVFYPLIMSGMIVAVITVLLIFVMPLFNQVFKQLGTEMTGFAGFLMKVSDLISNYAAVFAGILVFLLVLILFCVKTKPGRAFSNSVLKLFKSYRELREQIASCRFADGLALVLHSGLSPDRGFQLVYDLNEDKDYARKLRKCARYMNENGDSLAEAINRAGVFSGVYARLTSLGSKTGSLDGSMRQVATLYQEEIDAKITNYLSMLEPALIVVLSFVVGAILISVMFPLLGIMATI
ncbi:MAG: type II secretion system F family protein [Lachnospiraceae bacterium]|nr:type II secretion system F family protein [Lachnospiraceae bacterium]